MQSNLPLRRYGVWAPNIIQDPNTGKISGIFYDYMNELAAAANLKVEWREVSWSDFAVELNNRRIDGMCAGIWPTAAKAREMIFTSPINYVSINTYVRIDDNRFSDKEGINLPTVKIATMDAEISSIIARADFPNASTLEIPSTGSQSQMLLNVAD
jgi:ABC-type amino acid transport substrate-binding protein